MHFVIYALIILTSIQVQSDAPTTRTSPRELYQQAAAAIASQDLESAIGLLEELTQVHRDSELTQVAAFHLAECYLLQSKPIPALALLQFWSLQIDASPTVEQLEPGIKNKTWLLLARILDGLPDNLQTLEQLEQVMAGPKSQELNQLSDRWSTTVATELSVRYQRQQDFAAAQRWLNRLWEARANLDPSKAHELETRLHCELPLAWAEFAIANKQPNTAIEILQAALASCREVDRELALRFLLAEAYYAAGQPTQATEQFQWLTDQAAQSSAPTPWLAAVTLRRAELLVRSRAIADARAVLQAAKQAHADFELAYEFNYLLARCAVANIEFDEAASLLQQVIDAPAAAGTEAFARANWMLGEVHFLQRQYPLALAAYARVARLDEFPEWQARAWLQSAKCHELLGDAQAAAADYQRAGQFSQQPEIVQLAAERLAVIQSATSQRR